ncbi:MAG TPA: hypothetical protein VJH68_04015 [Candidatus Nanoarchaeia archaeon]|nr:hypothetical protein [Candidatus Nanoarchaeia archaeon]
MADSQIDLNRLEAAVRAAWSKETSSTPEEWSPRNPARGQCAVTACVVQDYIGGDVVWYSALRPDRIVESHYFNRMPGAFAQFEFCRGTEYDFTRLQFPLGTVIGEGGERKPGVDTKAYVLDNEATRNRYWLLRERVTKLLGDDNVKP